MSAAATADLLLALPLLVPLATAVACLLAGPGRRRQLAIGLSGAVLTLGAAVALLALVVQRGVVVTHLGGWPAPFGIAFAADRLSALMVVLAALIALFVALFAAPTLPGRRLIGRFMPMLHLMLAAMSAFFVAADLFNLYVWFELILVSSFGLLVLGRGRAAIEGAVKYFALNIFGSMLLLTGIALLYAMTGTLNLADLAVELRRLDRPHLTSAVAGLFIIAMGIKSGAFPLFFWLPASYHTPPIPVVVIFGGMLTKVGVYGMIRLFTLLFTGDPGYTHTLLLVIGGFTMVAGVLGAVAQEDLRRLLSFHIISQIGYMLVGLGLNTAAGVAAAIFFMMHIVITKTALFLVSGVVRRLRGSYHLDEIGGLYAARPAIALLFLVPALSLGGIPPLSGFPAKLALIQAALAIDHHVIVAVALAVSLLTLYSMSKVWTRAFWEPAPGPPPPAARRPLPVLLWSPPLLLVLLVIAIGAAAGPLMSFAERAADDLMTPDAYIEAVLSGNQEHQP